jgi:hypothetical protein
MAGYRQNWLIFGRMMMKIHDKPVNNQRNEWDFFLHKISEQHYL